MAESQSVAQELSDLINKGKPKEAWRLALSEHEGSPSLNDAHYRFAAVLAGEQAGASPDVIAAWKQAAKKCLNYSMQMEGDMHRDAALAALRQGNYKTAEDELRKAVFLHDGNDLRLGAIRMIWGRLEYEYGFYENAVAYHAAAEAMWQRIRHVDEPKTRQQWRLNNFYGEHRAAMAAVFDRHSAGRSYYLKIALHAYWFVMRYSKNPRQRIGAQFALFGGRWGTRLFDSVVEKHIRH